MNFDFDDSKKFKQFCEGVLTATLDDPDFAVCLLESVSADNNKEAYIKAIHQILNVHNVESFEKIFVRYLENKAKWEP